MQYERTRESVEGMRAVLLEFYAKGASPFFASVIDVLVACPQAKVIFRTFGVEVPA
jgi:hypothetical protein